MDKKLKENMPIYVQIMNRVREAIAAGELKPGDKIASVRDLAADFEVNPNTMQRALTELEREGLLLSERTQGCLLYTSRPFYHGFHESGQQAAESAAVYSPDG